MYTHHFFFFDFAAPGFDFAAPGDLDFNFLLRLGAPPL
jgi:hypothetical protein